MALRLGPLRIPWPGAQPEDPYWDSFINQAAADHRNMATEIIRRAAEGAVNPGKSDLHSPEITSSHLKELAHYLGADLVGIVDLTKQPPELAEGYPRAVLCAVRSEHDTRTAAGFGGQAAAQNGLYVTFVLSAYIRELGYRATPIALEGAERLAVAAGLGTLTPAGRLKVPKLGERVHLADVVRTDLPLAPDG